MAEVLASAGARVTVVTDAAIAAFLSGATAVVVGADAVGADSWVNKVGTRGLAAAASLAGTPVMVVASQDKFVPPALENRLALTPGPTDEVWADAPPRVAVSNPVFEHVSLSLAVHLVTERAAMAPSDAADVAIRWQNNALALIDALR